MVARRSLRDEERVAVHPDVRLPEVVLDLHPAAHLLTDRGDDAGGRERLALVVREVRGDVAELRVGGGDGLTEMKG